MPLKLFQRLMRSSVEMLLLKLLIIILILYLIAKAVRITAIKIMETKGPEFFTQKFIFNPGDSYLSLVTFRGESDLVDVEVDNLTVEVNFLQCLLNLTSKPLFSISCDRFDVKFKKIPRFKQKNKDLSPLTLEKWALQKVIIFISALIVKRAQLSLFKLSFTILGYSVSIERIIQLYKRTKSTAFDELLIEDVIVSKEAPFLRVPQIRATMSITSEIVKYILSLQLASLAIICERITMSFVNGSIRLEIAPVKLETKENETANGELNILPVEILLPKTSLSSIALSVTLEEITGTVSSFSAKNIGVTRMEDRVVQIPSIQFENMLLIVPSIDMKISLPMLLDMAMLTQIIPFPERNVMNPKSVRIPFNMKCEYIKLDLVLSDDHRFKFIFETGLKLKNSEIYSKKCESWMMVDNEDLHFAEFTSGMLAFNNTRSIRMKVDEMKVRVPAFVAFMSYIKVVGSTWSFLVKSFKGKNYVVDERIPPTPMKVDFAYNHIKLELISSSLRDTVTRAIEAKRIASEGIQLRMKHAFGIIEGSFGKRRVNMEAMEKKIEEMRFSLFRNALSMMNKHDGMMSVNMYSGVLVADGYRYATLQDSIDHLHRLLNRGTIDEVGKMNAMGVKFSMRLFTIQADRYGEVMQISNLQSEGSIFVVNQKVTKRSNVMYTLVKCEGRQYNIPSTTCSAMFVSDLKSEIDKGTLRVTPAFMDVYREAMFVTMGMRMKSVLHKPIRGLDILRFMAPMVSSMTFKRFKVSVAPADRAYLVKQYPVVVSISNLVLTMNMLSGSVEFDSIACFVQQRQFARFPAMKATLSLKPVNELNEKPNDYPLFVEIDGSRINDTEYDPYKLYRANSFSINGDITCCKDDEIKVQYDLVPVVMNLLKSDRGYMYSTKFVTSGNGLTISSGLVTMQLPTLIVAMLEDPLVIKVTNDGFLYRVETSPTKRVEISSSGTYVFLSHYAVQIGMVNIIKPMIVNQYGRTEVKCSQITSDFLPSIIPHLMKLRSVNKKKRNIISELEINKDFDHLIDMFKTEKVIISIGYIRLQGIFNSVTFAPVLELKTILVKLNESQQTNANMLSVQFIDFAVGEHENSPQPFVHIQDVIAHCVFSDDRQIMFVSCHNGVTMHARADLLDTIIPELIGHIPKDRPKRERHKSFASRLELSICGKNFFKFITSDGVVLTTLESEHIEIGNKCLEDGTETKQIEIESIRIVDETLDESDPFREVMVNKANGMLKFRVHKRKDMMKCPVYDEISLKLAPMVINISRKFIEDIIENFPSAKDLNIFDLESEIPESRNIGDEIPSFAVIDENEPIGFYGQVHFEKLGATLSYRRAKGIMFGEILHRQFEFSGLHLFDIFMSRNQVKEYVKSELRWALIKALPRLAIRQRRGSEC